MLRDHFPKGEVSLGENGEFAISFPGDEDRLKEFVAALLERLAKNFCYELAENSIRAIYASLQTKYGDSAQSSGLINFVPSGFLEKEKIRFLSKEELERRVLERTKELREVNANLEKIVLERTKELVSANNRLEEANQQLERLSKAKSEFLSLVSHQLRTPITVTKWGLFSLRESLDASTTQSTRELMNNLFVNNDRMMRMVDNLLSVAHIEEGRLVYQFERLSVEELLKEAMNDLVPLVQSKKIVFEYESNATAVFVRADKEKLYLAIENILENAIKYTKEGKRIKAEIGGGAGDIAIMVRDEGIGIPKEAQESIFQKFFRARNARQSDASGTGLGLFIVKKIVEDHGGHIRFESKEGEGTAFFITLPSVA